MSTNTLPAPNKKQTRIKLTTIRIPAYIHARLQKIARKDSKMLEAVSLEIILKGLQTVKSGEAND